MSLRLCCVLRCVTDPDALSEDRRNAEALVSACQTALSQATMLQTDLEMQPSNLALVNRFVLAASSCRVPLDRVRTLVRDVSAREEVARATSLADAAGDLSMCNGIVRRLTATTALSPELDAAVSGMIDDAKRDISQAEAFLNSAHTNPAVCFSCLMSWHQSFRVEYRAMHHPCCCFRRVRRCSRRHNNNTHRQHISP
mgnify:CR=1 FL=1